MRKTARWPAVLLAAGCVVLALLSLAGWRLLEQEKALDRARLRERLGRRLAEVIVHSTIHPVAGLRQRISAGKL